MTFKKTMKIPFEVIIRNKKTKEEIKVGDINIPVSVNVNKEELYKIMKGNVKKESKGDESNE